jgi:S1-C subfamily serine protease
MRKAFVAGLGAVAVIVGAFVLAPTAWTQAPRQTAPPAAPSPPGPRMMWLDGRGSSIGVRIQDADSGGVLIDDVEEESPADKAGLKRGDVVVEFDGERVRGARHFSRLVQETPGGRTVKATVMRDGSKQTFDITPSAGERVGSRRDRIIDIPEIERHVERSLEALPRNFSFDFDWDASPMIVGGARRPLGARLQPLTGQLAEYFGAKDGVLVSSVEEDSPAARAGLKAGDVITSVNGRPVNDPGDVSEEIREAEEAKEVEIGVVRDRKTLSLKAQVPERRSTTRRYTRPA